MAFKTIHIHCWLANIICFIGIRFLNPSIIPDYTFLLDTFSAEESKITTQKEPMFKESKFDDALVIIGHSTGCCTSGREFDSCSWRTFVLVIQMTVWW